MDTRDSYNPAVVGGADPGSVARVPVRGRRYHYNEPTPRPTAAGSAHDQQNESARGAHRGASSCTPAAVRTVIAI